MTVFLAIIAILLPASVTLVGFWNKRQSEKRLVQERKHSEKLLTQEHEQENARLRLDAAMSAAALFGPFDDTSASAAKSASGLLALARLDFADLAVALLVDLWSPQVSPESPAEMRAQDSFSVSTETAIQVIDEALESGKPEAQLMAAELLCRNAHTLDICQSLHWPSAVNSRWIPELPITAKLLIVDALVHMALANDHTKNAVRELAVRLYGIWKGDPQERVQGAIGTLMSAIIPAVRSLGYTNFIQGPGHGLVKLKDMEQAVASASPHSDGYIETMVQDRSAKLKEWSQECTALSFSPGMLAT
jgi:hypothetical protein